MGVSVREVLYKYALPKVAHCVWQDEAWRQRLAAAPAGQPLPLDADHLGWEQLGPEVVARADYDEARALIREHGLRFTVTRRPDAAWEFQATEFPDILIVLG
jgi:hypothetical protein